MRLRDDELIYLGAAAMLPHMLLATNSTSEIEEQAGKALAIATMLLVWQRRVPKEVEDEFERLAKGGNEQAQRELAELKKFRARRSVAKARRNRSLANT